MGKIAPAGGPLRTAGFTLIELMTVVGLSSIFMVAMMKMVESTQIAMKGTQLGQDFNNLNSVIKLATQDQLTCRNALAGQLINDRNRAIYIPENDARAVQDVTIDASLGTPIHADAVLDGVKFDKVQLRSVCNFSAGGPPKTVLGGPDPDPEMNACGPVGAGGSAAEWIADLHIEGSRVGEVVGSRNFRTPRDIRLRVTAHTQAECGASPAPVPACPTGYSVPAGKRVITDCYGFSQGDPAALCANTMGGIWNQTVTPPRCDLPGSRSCSTSNLIETDRDGSCDTADRGVVTVNGLNWHSYKMAIVKDPSMKDWGHAAPNDEMELYCVIRPTEPIGTRGTLAVCLSNEIDCPWRGTDTPACGRRGP